jgi:hypothetical protein
MKLPEIDRRVRASIFSARNGEPGRTRRLAKADTD